MFTEERQSIILEKLKETGRVEVCDLAEKFDVSVDTVRRDLKVLEDRGRLRKTHGGAIPVKMGGSHLQMKERSKVNSLIKDSIARRAAELIDPGDSVLLDGSSSVLALIPHLSAVKDLSVFTSSPVIACALIDNGSKARVELIGGVLRPGADNTTGFEAVQSINRLHTDKVFMGVCGLNREGRLSTFNPDEAPMHQAMLQAGQEVILLMDSTKWEQSFLKDLGVIPSNCRIVSDDKLPREIESVLKKSTDREIIIERV